MWSDGDIVSMTSFAPLPAKEGHTQWNPDLIYFNNIEVKPTVDYYVQKMFGQNSGDEYIVSIISLSNNKTEIKERIASSLVRDSKTGDYILKLVNLLPVKVNSNINLMDLPLMHGSASLTVLKGELNDDKVKPKNSEITVASKFQYCLPAYSLSVIRIKSN